MRRVFGEAVRATPTEFSGSRNELPELPPVNAVVGGEEERAGDIGEVASHRAPVSLRAPVPQVDVLDELRPGGGPVALPELEPVGAVVGEEEEGAGDVGELAGEREPAPAPGVDVLDELRPGGRPVALPELAPVGAVAGGEEEGAGDVGEAAGDRER